MSRRSPSRLRYLCRLKVWYRSEESSERAARAVEAQKGLNPGVLRNFKCTACDGWHIGTWITKRADAAKREGHHQDSSRG